jgi:hypothetical protein
MASQSDFVETFYVTELTIHGFLFFLNVSENDMKNLWKFLQKTDPSMQKTFENILENSYQEIRRSKLEFLTMETALHR